MIKQALRKSNVNPEWRNDSLKKGFWANGSVSECDKQMKRESKILLLIKNQLYFFLTLAYWSSASYGG